MDDNTAGWIERCLGQLPPRHRVLYMDKTFLEFDLLRRQGVIRIEYNVQPPDTIICVNVLEHTRSGKIICGRAYEMLSENGILIVASKITDDMHPGMLRYYLKPFAWKYVTAVPNSHDTFAIAGKGEKYYNGKA